MSLTEKGRAAVTTAAAILRTIRPDVAATLREIADDEAEQQRAAEEEEAASAAWWNAQKR